MQYLISVLTDEDTLADDDEMAAIDVFNDGLRADGHWVFAGGLTAPANATVVADRRGAGQVVAGPFVETREFIAGFWIVEAPDLDVALALAAAGSKACNRRVEVRPFA